MLPILHTDPRITIKKNPPGMLVVRCMSLMGYSKNI
jgi:hypothetical protein